MVRFIAEQARLFGPHAQRPSLRALPSALPRSGRLRVAAKVGPSRPRGLFFAHHFQRRVGLDGRRVDGLRVAGHQPPGHARGKDVVEQALEHGGRKQLARAAHG